MRHDGCDALSRLDPFTATAARSTPGGNTTPCLPVGRHRGLAGGLRRRQADPTRCSRSFPTAMATHGISRSRGSQRRIDARTGTGGNALPLWRQHPRIRLRLQRLGDVCLSRHVGPAIATYFPGTGPSPGSTHRTNLPGTRRSGVLRHQGQCHPCGHLRGRRALRTCAKHGWDSAPGSLGRPLLARPLQWSKTCTPLTKSACHNEFLTKFEHDDRLVTALLRLRPMHPLLNA